MRKLGVFAALGAGSTAFGDQTIDVDPNNKYCRHIVRIPKSIVDVESATARLFSPPARILLSDWRHGSD